MNKYYICCTESSVKKFNLHLADFYIVSGLILHEYPFSGVYMVYCTLKILYKSLEIFIKELSRNLHKIHKI